MITIIIFKMKKVLIINIFMAIALLGVAQKPMTLPIISTKYTADPAPLVYNDTVFLYTSHDEDDAMGFKMLDWLLYYSTDMVNWTEYGAVASLKDFDWVPYDNGLGRCSVLSGIVSFICIAPCRVVWVLVFWWRTLLMVLLKIRWERL